MHMKNRKQLNIVNCVLTCCIYTILEINGRSILFLQFIKTYMLFRMPFAPYRYTPIG